MNRQETTARQAPGTDAPEQKPRKGDTQIESGNMVHEAKRDRGVESGRENEGQRRIEQGFSIARPNDIRRIGGMRCRCRRAFEGIGSVEQDADDVGLLEPDRAGNLGILGEGGTGIETGEGEGVPRHCLLEEALETEVPGRDIENGKRRGCIRRQSAALPFAQTGNMTRDALHPGQGASSRLRKRGMGTVVERGVELNEFFFAKKRILPITWRAAEGGTIWESWNVDDELDARFLRTLQMKPRRTASGVATITVITKPWPCANNCIYCPNDPRMPKSYLSDEPACQRAERNGFDPYLQVASRLRTLAADGACHGDKSSSSSWVARGSTIRRLSLMVHCGAVPRIQR